MAIGDFEPGIVTIDVPGSGLCRFTPAEARAYVDVFETGAGEDELAAWTLETFDREGLEGRDWAPGPDGPRVVPTAPIAGVGSTN